MTRRIWAFRAFCFGILLLGIGGSAQGSFFDNLATALTKGAQGGQSNGASAKKLPTGTLKNSSNLRSGPGTTNPKLVLLPSGTTVVIQSKAGNWYQVNANVSGSAYSGWIYAPLVQIDEGLTAARASSNGPASKQASQDPLTKHSTITYAGYTKEYLPVKKMLKAGDLKGIEALYKQKQEAAKKKAKSAADVIKEIGFLGWLESGTLAIDQGNYSESVQDFSHAEDLLDMRQQKSLFESLLSDGVSSAAGLVTGNEESGDYKGEGFERVLMLNYKSIAFLLDGKRNAYNVTRRAIDWQNIEKKAFEAKQRKVQEELKKKESQKTNKESASPADVGARVDKDYAKYDAKALSVPSAYVNPFGYYVAGMVQEYESYDDWSLRDNARISYSKALELNPKSKVLKRAVKEMKKRNARSGTKLVHVVVADGFVPEKKLLTYGIATNNGVIPIKLTLYEPDPSRVSRIEAQTTGGKRWAVLSPVADVEAIVLRHQKDMEPFRKLKVVLATVSGQVVKGLLGNLGFIGNAISNAREEMAAPDMRSWMSLPSTIQAARLHLPKSVSRFKLVSYDKRGRVLASRVVNINKNSHDFVFARTLDNKMYAYASNKLWMVSGQ